MGRFTTRVRSERAGEGRYITVPARGRSGRHGSRHREDKNDKATQNQRRYGESQYGMGRVSTERLPARVGAKSVEYGTRHGEGQYGPVYDTGKANTEWRTTRYGQYRVLHGTEVRFLNLDDADDGRRILEGSGSF